ncbi:hypothetical protein MWE_1389 [Helicobacter pylori XZ274]|nr:hypothetical protein MWE_1389 [Helicobacter pylori XZ274]
MVTLFYSKVYFLYLRLIFSRDRGYFEITFSLNAHKIALLRNLLITSSFVFNLKKTLLSVFILQEKWLIAPRRFLYNKTQSANFFSENSIGFYSFTFEKYNSLAFKIIIRSFRMKKQILTGVLLSVLAVSSAYAHKDKKDAKKT